VPENRAPHRRFPSLHRESATWHPACDVVDAMRKAFSLLEIMVAAGLLVTLVIPVLMFNQRGVIEAGVTQEELIGRQLLMDLCERFKNSSPEDLQAVERDPSMLDRDDMLIPLRAGAAGNSGMAFARRVEIEENMDGVAGLHRVTFTVAWTSRHRKAQVAKLSRLIHWH
jgi:hypothetical protein